MLLLHFVETKQRTDHTSLAEDTKKWIIHGPKSRKWRNLSIGAGLCTLFCILLFAKLSAVQAYSVSAAFICLAAYAIVLRFRD